MTVEVTTNPQGLNTAWPLAADLISEGDDHIRLLKTVLKTTFAAVTGAILASHTELNYMVGVTSPVQGQLNGKAALAGPNAWTGTQDFSLATVTLGASTIIGAVSAAELQALDGITGNVQTQLDGKLNDSGDTGTGTFNFTGATVNVATQPVATSNNTAASTAFVAAVAFSAALPGQAGNAGKFIRTDGANASWQWPVLPIIRQTGNFTASVGSHHDMATAGITGTLPAPGTLTAGDLVEVSNGSNAVTCVLDFNGAKMNGQATPALMTFDRLTARISLIWSGNATDGWLAFT